MCVYTKLRLDFRLRDARTEKLSDIFDERDLLSYLLPAITLFVTRWSDRLQNTTDEMRPSPQK